MNSQAPTAMIQVNNLTKRYPRQTAVDDISFSVKEGELVGFLGPNGAGKTTTMRILTGYIPATGGEVRVNGFDVVKDSLAVRRSVGYLPESCPLYGEMRVREYLAYRARLKGVGLRGRRGRIAAVLEMCGIESVAKRIIGQLSKGYRQRVGLADALVHSPRLLVLDEPTIGLDPNQIREMRLLIKGLASDHTVLLSSHILPEVEQTCDRVLIIHEGKIVASDTPGNLAHVLAGCLRVVAELRGHEEEVLDGCRALPGVTAVAHRTEGAWITVEIEGRLDHDLREEVFDLAVRRNWKLRELKIVSGNLEEAFTALTRKGNGGGGS